MFVRNPAWSLFVLLFLISPHQLHAGKFRKAIIRLCEKSTNNPNTPPSQIFELRTQALPLVEDLGDFIEIIRIPFQFNDANLAFHDELQKLYEEFFNNHVTQMFINKKAVFADMYALEEVLIFWTSALELRTRFLEANRPRDLKTVLDVIKGTSKTIKKASLLNNFFPVVIEKNTELIVPLLLEATDSDWRQFSQLFENAFENERLKFFRTMLKKARRSEHVFRIVEYCHNNYGASYTDLLLSEIFTFNKKLVGKWQLLYKDYLKLLNYTHFYSTDLKIKIMACGTVRTFHEYDELLNAGFQKASDFEIEKWKKSFSEQCHLSAEVSLNTVDEIKSITENENRQILDAMPIKKKWFGKTCELCQETQMIFRVWPCQCAEKTNFCDKCIKNIVYNNLTPSCPLCRTPVIHREK